ncbi:hypothetical protein KAR91_62500 [Candidatus Pacearchaeota archaeon]|nr:hypothetical protein [Candidatus Pacearchaeota archaeon]
MPPKRKKRVRKIKKSKPYVMSRICQVNKCRSHAVCMWNLLSEINKKPFGVCDKHLTKHHDRDDKFTFYEHFNVSRPNVAGGVDRFGFPVASDMEEFTGLFAAREKKDNSESLLRLQDWKERNPNKERKKVFRPKKIRTEKPRQTLSSVKIKDVSNDEMDDVLAGILGG